MKKELLSAAFAVMAAMPLAARAEQTGPIDVSFFSWASGSPPTDMKVAGAQMCVLTRIAGKFLGGGENVYLELNPSGQYGPHWQINGSAANDQGVYAQAACVPKIRFEPGNMVKGLDFGYPKDGLYVSNCGQAAAMQGLGYAPNRAYFLRGITGAYRGGGESIMVSGNTMFASSCATGGGWGLYEAMNVSGAPVNYWTPSGNVTSPKKATFALSFSQPDYASGLWNKFSNALSGTPFLNPGPSMWLAPKDAALCGLVGVSGKFDGGGEYAELTIAKFQGKDYWHFAVNSSASGGYMQAAARCVARVQG